MPADRPAEPTAGERDVRSAVADLSSIDLPALLAAAALQTRVDRKYLVPRSTAAALVGELAGDLAALEIDGARHSRYESAYFDTPELDCYLAAAHAAGAARRCTRTYLDSAACLLEVKRVSARGETVKVRVDHRLAERYEIGALGGDFLIAQGLPAGLAQRLRVELVTDYLRTTLLESGGARVTLDLGLRCATPDGTHCTLTDLVVVETKSGGPATAVDRALWARGFRPVPISKYCTGLAAVRPSVPANKWNRTLRRHFGWTRALPAALVDA